MNTINNKYYRIIPWLFILFPVILFWCAIAYFSLNIPMADDYDAILGFMIKFIDSGSLLGKIQLIFSQHNEHRIVLSRIICIIQYYISGEINFIILIIIGNIVWTFILLIIYLEFKKFDLPAYYFIPVPFFVFQFVHLSSGLWSSASIANNPVITLTFLSFYALNINSKLKYYAVFISMALAVMAFGSGVFCIFIIALFFMVEKEWRLMAITICILTILLIIYFYDYNAPQSNVSISVLLNKLPDIIVFFFSFLGSFMRNIIASVITGTLLFFVFCVFLIKGYYRNNKILFLMIGYIIIVGAVAALTRSEIGHGDRGISQRYSMNSLLFISLLYMVLISVMKEKFKDKLKIFYFIILGISIILNISIGIFFLKKADSKYNILVDGAVNYIIMNDGGKLYYPVKEEAKRILDISVEKGIYDIRKEKNIIRLIQDAR